MSYICKNQALNPFGILDCHLKRRLPFRLFKLLTERKNHWKEVITEQKRDLFQMLRR
jgi:hypothetical protein